MEDNEIKPVEIKDLNKTQLIWLAILLSFVISIATGIVTVTLMQQAPPAVTQTINRVVQQTIEKVVPDSTSGTTKVQTVIIKEDDLVVDAVSKTRENLGTLLSSKDAEGSLGSTYSLGSGSFLVPNAPVDSTKSYVVKEGSDVFDVKVLGTSPLGFSVVSVVAPDATSAALPKSSFGKDADVKVGQTDVLVSGTAISKGLIQSVAPITIDPKPSTDSIGSYLVDLDGNIAGLVLPSGDSGTTIVGADAITAFIANPTPPASSASTSASPASSSTATTN